MVIKVYNQPENKTVENTYNDFGFMIKSESAKRSRKKNLLMTIKEI